MYRRIEVIMTMELLRKYGGQLPTMSFSCSSMVKSGLPASKNTIWYDNKRPRHYFTEKGWKQCGHAVLSEIRSRGLQARIVTLKEKDPRINMFYEDAWQVVITCRKNSLGRKK